MIGNNLRTINLNETFKGLQVSTYNVIEKHPNNEKVLKELTIYEMEPKDIPFLNDLEKKIKLLRKNARRKDKKNLYKIVISSIEEAKSTLKLRKDFKINDPSVIYLASIEKQPCGILMGNMPKINTDDCQLTFSNRNKPNETELDWIATWQPKKGQYLKCTGTALVSEFFNFCKNLKNIDSIFVRSEVPHKSKAFDFYHNLGFNHTGEKTMPVDNNSRPKEIAKLLLKSFKPDRSHIIPMEISTKDAVIKADHYFSKLNRTELEQRSFDLSKKLDLNI